MEIKKSPKANLENKKVLFREIGLIVALLLVWGAFEWSTSDKLDSGLDQTAATIIEEETVPITQEEPPPPPEQIKEPIMTEELEIVDDDVKVTTEFISSDDSQNQIEIKPYVETTAKEEEEVDDDPIPYTIIQDKPKFQGGDANDFSRWVQSNFRYPEDAQEAGISGRVMVQFIIDVDGSVKDVQVVRRLHPSVDNEVVRIVKSSPKWTPGKQRGKATKVRYTLPFSLQLR